MELDVQTMQFVQSSPMLRAMVGSAAFQAMVDPPQLAPRSPGWAAAERKHLVGQPDCQVCGIVGACEVHHVRPHHLYPEMELDDANLMTLCRLHHFEEGHLLDWRAWNPDVRADVTRRRGKIEHRVYVRL